MAPTERIETRNNIDLRVYVEPRIIISLYHISDRNQWNFQELRATITIRYIDSGQVIGFDRIFQSIFAIAA